MTNGYMVITNDVATNFIYESPVVALKSYARDDARQLAMLALERHTDRLRAYYGAVSGGCTVVLTERQDLSGYDVLSIPYVAGKAYETLTTIVITEETN